MNDRGRERLCQSLRKIGELIVPNDSDEEQFLIVGKSLNYLAGKTLFLTPSLGSSSERGKLANQISRIATNLADTMPYLLAQCGECSEERAIRTMFLALS
jgi:hypothetical protein